MTSFFYWSGVLFWGAFFMLLLGTIGGVIVEKVRGREAKPPH